MSSKNIIIFGPPGVGKGTISNLLEEKLDMIHFSTGNILRREIDINSDLGNLVKIHVNSGKLVPDSIITDLVLNNIIKNKEYFIKNKGFILDGFPRNLIQAQLLNDRLAKINLKINTVIYLYVNDKQILISRLSSRLICRKCEKNYNRIFSPSKLEYICDNCGGDLYKREDDDVDVIKKRIQLYENMLVKLINFFKYQKIIINRIDSSREKNIILKEIINFL